SKQIECPYCKYSISKPEEKRTDVNISVRMMADCVQDKTDVIVLISADTDLIPPLNFIHTNYPNKKVKVFFPPGSHALELHNHLRTFHSKWVFLEKNERRFRNAVMPHTITVGNQSVSIPEKWK
ncbi:NYN domain-containing protein, partial [Prevotella sp.]